MMKFVMATNKYDGGESTQENIPGVESSTALIERLHEKNQPVSICNTSLLLRDVGTPPQQRRKGDRGPGTCDNLTNQSYKMLHALLYSGVLRSPRGVDQNKFGKVERADRRVSKRNDVGEACWGGVM